jgi:hypothetical protein
MMEPRQFIRSDIVASLVAHLSIVALLVLSSEVHPFGSVPSEPIAIDLVTAAEVENKPEPAPTPQIPLPDKSDVTPAAALPSTPMAPEPSPEPQQRQTSRSAAKVSPKEPVRESVAQPQAQPPSSVAPAAAGYTQPEPDITVKYHVMLGLPEGLPMPMPMSGGDGPGDGVDATASTTANVASSVIAEFRRHLRTCSRLPPEIAASDKVTIKLRSFLAPDGTLSSEPILIEASASVKGPILMQGAISALQACQPYTMLPKDHYGEWKVIDLVFTPKDFAG